MVDVPIGGFLGDRSAVDERKLIRFPSVTEGKLADAITLLSRPGSPKELGSEDQFRHMYRSMAASWPTARPRRNRLSMMVGAAAVASLFATATGLSAASVMPAPADHVVNGILRPLDVAGAPPAVTGTPVNHNTVTTASHTSQGGGPSGSAPATTGTAPSVSAGTNSAVKGTSACRHKVSCTPRHPAAAGNGTTNTNTSGGGGAGTGAGTAVGTGPTGGGAAGAAAATATTGSVGTGSSGGSGSGSSGGTGTGRGGNQGAGGGSTGAGHRKGGAGQGTRHRGRHGSGGSPTTTTTGAGTGPDAASAPSSTTTTTATIAPSGSP